jgi:pimeloyl-ACP methyl ester carboxylesterase
MPGGPVLYSFRDGARGVLGGEGAALVCQGGSLVGADGASWQRIETRTTRTTFDVDGATLVGELIEPEGVENPPLMVLAHGSENFGWVGGVVQIPYLLAADGISVFIFDKRGTGLSDGEFNMNFRRLARDLVAASEEAKRLAEGRHSSFGLAGFSQGGWVAPLAALDVEPDFVVVNYGLVLSPQEEDAEEVQLEMRAMGYGPDALAKARAVTDATGAVMIEGIERGLAGLEAVRSAYGDEPWFSEIEGEFTGRILSMSNAELLEAGDSLNRFDIEYDYDAMAVLQALSAPLLWIAAGEDRAAPPELTLERLNSLRSEGRPIEVAVFPDTDHGIVEFEEQPDGSRVYGNRAQGYFALLSDWSKGCLAPAYGRAELIGVASRREDCG